MALGHVVTRGYGNGTLAGDPNLVAVRGYTVAAAAASIALSTTITDEASIVAGGATISLVLSNDTWINDDTSKQGIIDGLAGSASWNSVVQTGLAPADVSIAGDTATITLPAFASYDIASDDTVTATIPALSLVGAIETVAVPTFTVTATVQAVATTSGGNYRIFVEPKRRFTRKVEEVERTERQEAEAQEKEELADFSEFLDGIRKIGESPLPEVAKIQEALKLFLPVAVEDKVSLTQIVHAILAAQVENSKFMEEMRNQILSEIAIERGVVVDQLSALESRIEEAQTASERARLIKELARLQEVDEQTELAQDMSRAKLQGLLIALAAV